MVEDIKMNAFQEVEDYEYIYVELADGSQAKMKKERSCKFNKDRN